MKKTTKILLIIIFVLLIGNLSVNASAYLVPSSFENFFKCLNDGDQNVYNYIDISNTELYNNVQNYLHSVEIYYQIIDIEMDNNQSYYIKAKIQAEGINWNVKGFTTEYKLEKINGEYKITDTNLFNIIGSDNIVAFVFKILAIIFGIIFIIIIIIVTIVIMCIKKSKKRKVNNTYLKV